MSRIIVKNIPDYLDEKRLKQHIGAHIGNEITDIKIVRRPDGTSRKFGFVGFKKEENAIEAQRYFDKTFIDTARINVSIARAINDESLKEEKARKRGGQGIAVEHKNAKGEQKDEKNGDEIKKSSSSSKAISFEEFMEVMKPRSKRKAWGNGENQDADAALDPATFSEEVPKSVKKRKSAKEDEEKSSDEVGEAEKEVPMDAAVNDEGMTDLEYMYKRMKRRVGADLEEEEQKAYEQSDDEDGSKEKKEELPTSEEIEEEEMEEMDEKEAQKQERKRIALEKKAIKDQEDADSIMESGRLFVRNLPFETVEDDLEEYFSKFGQVSQTHITLDKATKKPKGIAFVTFSEPAHALSAFRTADGHTFQGRLLHILPAAQKNENATDPSTLKGKKKQEMKANATKDFNWNTLYMSSDAVASSVAARLGIEKTDILNPQDGEQNTSVSPAVRLALAETSVINETRDFLKSEGINVDAFEGVHKQKRSDTVILVKNIPYGASSEVLQSMFEKHGTVERTVMPPTGTIAIVEMQLPGEAKVAFRSLAYKRLGNSVLYLEKAPVGIIGSKPITSDLPSKADGPAKEEKVHPVNANSTEVPNEGTAAAGATLFVKNLSFSTTDERLASAFGKLADVTFVRVQKRSVRQRDGKGEVKLSMGFGFVGFGSIESARIAQKVMDKSMLDGHLLNVTFAKRGHDADDEAVNGKSTNEERTSAPSTKLIIKNLPFQATKKDVRALFAAHGKLKSVRVPRKGLSSVGGTAGGVRGFGFAEFVNRNEALNAYQALRHSHLLGRHLILDWDLEGNSAATSASTASTSEDQGTSVDRLRRKAAQQAAISQAASGPGAAHKRGKLHLNDEDIRQAALDEKRRAVEDDDEEDEEDI